VDAARRPFCSCSNKLLRQVLQTFGDEPFTLFVVLGQRMFVTLGLRLSGEFRELEKRDPRSRCVCQKSRLTMGPRGTKTSRWSVLMMGRPWSLWLSPFYFSAGNACPADRRSPEVETHNRWNVWLIGFRRWFGLRVPKRSWWKIRGHLFHSSVSSDSDPLSFAEGFRLFSDARGSVRPETRAQGGCHHQI